MARNQKGVSLPREWWENLVRDYLENEQAYGLLKIDSPTKLLEVRANFGKQPTDDLVEELRKKGVLPTVVKE